MLAFILLAQLAAPPVQLPEPTRRQSQAGGTMTLSDYARNRKLCPDPAGCGTFSVTGASGMPALTGVNGEDFEIAATRLAANPGAPVNWQYVGGAWTPRVYAYPAAPDPVYGVNTWPYLYGGGYNNWQTRQHGVHPSHVAPSVQSVAPSVAAPAVAAPVQNSSSGRTGGGRTTRKH